LIVGDVVDVTIAANLVQVLGLIELGASENTDIEIHDVVLSRSDDTSEISLPKRFLLDENSALSVEVADQAFSDVLLECHQVFAQGRVSESHSVVAAELRDHSVSHPASHAHEIEGP
jgi:hypothetical protein